uniref:non-specific serine/threonine protein kinase n=1 Tax=Opuntia streptacantha TaxID=393608 RepID=A0A7C9E4R3_OPUST
MRIPFFVSPRLLTILIFIFFIGFSPVFEAATDTLTPANSLSFNQTLISSAGKFELGFFRKEDPSRYYVGIRYKDIPSDDIFIWVANRDAPLFNDSSILKLDNHGNLMILDGGSNIRWSSNTSTAVNPVVQLLDSGNLVIREARDQNPEHYLWQSFDHPTDTLLPGQKLGVNLKTGLNRSLTSWKGPSDPGTGQYSFKMDYHGDPEVYLWQGNNIIYRSGPWVGLRFSGVPEMKSGESGFNFAFHTGPDEVYYTFELPKGDAVKSRLMVTYDGFLRRYTWVPDAQQWTSFWYARKDPCDYYRTCGPYGVCNTSALSYCQCPRGFSPKNPRAWTLRDGTDGCVRDTNLECLSDGFLKLENMKLPETTTAVVDMNMSLKQCGDLCKRNCRCTAYANAQVIRGVGTGCVYWTDDLTDMRDYTQGGQDLYVRLAASDLGI